MACKHCGRDVRIHGRGYCSACYSRLKRKGSIERSHAVNKGKMCGSEGCERRAFSKGFCELHYRHAQHPLRTTWKLIRSRGDEGEYPPSWESFEAFLSDIGERPTPRHKLRRLDPTKPYAHDNVHWQEPVYASGNTPEYHSEYSKAWNLKKSFGLTVGEYDQMLAAQGGVCAICKGAETAVERRTEVVRALIVDHCHATEAKHTLRQSVRGLLCNRCNRTLGLARDDTDLLRAMISYLDRHRPTQST